MNDPFLDFLKRLTAYSPTSPHPWAYEPPPTDGVVLKSYVLRVLAEQQGDDLWRARHDFSKLTPQQMQQPYGASGMTPTELLKMYEYREQRLENAIAWVNSKEP